MSRQRHGGVLLADAIGALVVLAILAGALATGAWFRRMETKADNHASEQDAAVLLAQRLREGNAAPLPTGWNATDHTQDGLRLTTLTGPLGTRLTVIRP